ncbi:MAG: bestrophin family ion channel [Myxococcota bacterium]
MLIKPKREFPTLLFTWQGSALSQTWPFLLGVLAFSSVLTWANHTYDLSWVDFTATPFSILGLTLAIFLAFRNNACYDRWWEGRKLWGQLVNESRSYVRLVLTLISGDDPEVKVMQRSLVYRAIAFVHGLRLHLRGQPRWEELGMFLPAAERQGLVTERNKPMAIVQTMAERHRGAFDRGWLSEYHLPMLEHISSRFLDIQGACERIKNTPVPLSYTELTHRIVALYVIALPFGILHHVGDFTPVVTTMVAYAFLGLDVIGSQLENPFEEDPHDLPLSQLSRMIENDLRARLGETDLRADLTPDQGLLL